MHKLDTLMTELGVDLGRWQGEDIACVSPIDGTLLARLRGDRGADCAARVTRAEAAFIQWRRVPPPRRGELVRLFGQQLRRHKEALAQLVTMESGKILQEGLGEVQEMIDICDFAVGLSRQLYGLTIATERPGHRMMETWHPLGPVGIISAFNFPVAVWSWNAALALVCGDSLLWKPSEKTPLCAIAAQSLLEQAQREFGGDAPQDLSQILLGGRECGAMLAEDARVPIISATGSTRMGREVAQGCAARLARCILELGGNNAAIIAPSADLELAVRAVVFAAAGSAGQRCTSLRRLFVHASIYERVRERLLAAFHSLPVGNPLDAGTLVGPLIDADAGRRMQEALRRAQAEGGRVHGGERVELDECSNAYYARPALVEMAGQGGVVQEETFAPILYLLRYQTLEQAIAWNNAVPQGLASSIFSNDLRETELFLSAAGSDCGIANVNIGPSGAEIGGAFGGEKETGGGREAGSDAWKSYMRRATNTINYSNELPLAQGVRFSI
jgi:aldehyde dehydrogenase (NAD+)